MKVIAKTGSEKYLVEISMAEIGMMYGMDWARISAFQNHVPSEAFERDSYGIICGFRIGAEIAVKPAFDYLAKLAEHEKSLRASASVLRGMADMLDGVLPTTIVPPAEAKVAA